MSTPIDDVRVLRAIAHPVRNRILGELDAVGSMRAADVAERLGIPANQASFHLRQLAKYGLVEEDAEAARDRRDRVWRPRHPEGLSVEMGDLAARPGGDAAARVYLGSVAAEAHRLVEHAYSHPAGPGRTPGVHQSTSDDRLLLGPEEAVALREELTALVDRFRERGRSGQRDGDGVERRTYVVHTMLLPRPDPEVEPPSGPVGFRPPREA